MSRSVSSDPPRRALIVVDPQVDFFPGGALPVPEGEGILEPIHRLLHAPFDLRIVTQDWHPPDHSSFSGPHAWPVHCVQDTPGAAIHPELTAYLREELKPDLNWVCQKGMEREGASYSAFGDPDLDPLLREKRVEEIWVCGLALEYCVRETCQDAARLGYRTTLVLDATRPVDPERTAPSLLSLARAGVHFAYAPQAIR